MGAFFDGIKQALGVILAFFYDIIPNYGISIVLLTILINVVLFPLTLKQTRSTRAFQEIQPEIKKLQAKYKEDPQTLQQEMMKLQRQAGATPGGCLIPLVVQMPIWFALFRVLQSPTDWIPTSSSLHALVAGDGGHFLGMDLGSTPASVYAANGFVRLLPYLILMLLMVGAQYVQQWHAQPKNQKKDRQAQQMQAVTKIMPLFIGFISWNFPAGLTLYWTTANLFRLGQQVVIFRMDGRPPAPADREAKASEDSVEPSQERPSRPQGSAKKRRRRRRN